MKKKTTNNKHIASFCNKSNSIIEKFPLPTFTQNAREISSLSYAFQNFQEYNNDNDDFIEIQVAIYKIHFLMVFRHDAIIIMMDKETMEEKVTKE